MDLLERELARLRDACVAARELGAGSCHLRLRVAEPRDVLRARSREPRACHPGAARLRASAGGSRRGGRRDDARVRVPRDDDPGHARDDPRDDRGGRSPAVRVNFDPVNLLGDLPSVYASGARRRMWKSARAVVRPERAPEGREGAARPRGPRGGGPAREGRARHASFFEVCRDLGPGTGDDRRAPGLEDVDDAIRFAIASAAENGITFERSQAPSDNRPRSQTDGRRERVIRSGGPGTAPTGRGAGVQTAPRRGADRVPDLAAAIREAGIQREVVFTADPLLIVYAEVSDADAYPRLWAMPAHETLGGDDGATPGDGA